MSKPTKLTSAAILSLFLTSAPALAIDREALAMLQFTLKEHGFDAGKPDGLLGSKTRQAIAGFAKKYNLPEDPEAMLNGLISRSVSHSFKITSEINLTEESLEQIKRGVAQDLKDPSSAEIRDVKVVEGPGGRFLCGEVNGKNSYGAYAGFVPFRSFGMGLFSDYSEIPYKIEGDTSVVWWTCALAIPLKHF